MTRWILSGALLALLAPGCMETTVKSSGPRVLTAEEIARVQEEQKAKRLDEQEKNGGKPKEGDKAASQKQMTPAQQLEYYMKKSEAEPNEAQWHFECGRLYEILGKQYYDLALLRYQRGEELLLPKGAYTGPAAWIGRVYAKKGEAAPALRWLNQAIAVKPKTIEGYYLDPDYRESYFLIGAIEYHQKHTAQSQDAFRMYLKYGGDRNKVVDFFPELVAE